MRLKGRRGRMRRSCLGWLLGGVAALLLIAGIVVYLGLTPAALQLHRGGALPGSRAGKEAPALQAGQFELSFTPAQLNQTLRQAVGERVQDPKLTLEPGVIVITGRPTQGQLTVAARIELEPFVEGGKIKVKVRKATLGSLPLPPALSNLLAQQVEQMLAEQQAKQKGLVVDSVQVSAGALTIQGHLQPAGR